MLNFSKKVLYSTITGARPSIGVREASLGFGHGPRLRECSRLGEGSGFRDVGHLMGGFLS